MNTIDRLIAGVYLANECSPALFWEQASELLLLGAEPQPLDVDQLSR